jgi:hypothetical protein
MNSDFESNDNETLQGYAGRRWRDFHVPLVDKRDLLMSRPQLLFYDKLELWVAEAETVMANACSASEIPNKHIHQKTPEDDVQ